VINSFHAYGFEHIEETLWRSGPTAISFRTDTYGDTDSFEIDVSNLQNATIRVSGTIDGYVKVGNPLDGNPFVHCPKFDISVSGTELMEKGRVRLDLGGTELYVAIERIADAAMSRDVGGTFEIEPVNGPHGFRPVYLQGLQIDGATAWTSAMYIHFA